MFLPSFMHIFTILKIGVGGDGVLAITTTLPLHFVYLPTSAIE
uniref:Uncharacterized protein n=1 Tax=Arundo donax TaxID=35708 RepID=A0A0A8ZZJ3_ARUDO